MNINNLLSIVTVCLVIFSLAGIPFEIVPNKSLRVGISGLLFLFALQIFSFRNLLGLFTFLLFVLCDIFLLFWEEPFAKLGYYLSHIIVLAFLIILTIRELKWPKISYFEIFWLLFFFLVNSAILYFLGNNFDSGIDNPLNRILFYTNGFLILFLVMSAFFYSVRFANDVSVFFFIGIMALTFSDLLLFGIYFTDLVEMRYIDNAIYVTGLYFLLRSYLKHRKLKAIKLAEENQSQVEASTKEDISPKVYR